MPQEPRTAGLSVTIAGFASRRLRGSRARVREREGGLACYTHDEIGEAVGVSLGEANSETKELSEMEALPKLNKLLATYTQEEVGEAVGLDQSEVARATGEVWQMDSCPKATKLLRS